MAWDQLLTIMEEAKEIERIEATGPPTICPYDLTPLSPAPDGRLFCPFNGDYLYPDDGLIR